MAMIHFSSLLPRSSSSPLIPFSPLPSTKHRLCTLCLSLDRHSTTTPPLRSASSPELRLAFTGGGTGGRIYSAIAIADDLRLLHPNSHFLFLGSPSPSLESSAIASSGYPFSPVPTRHLPFSLFHSIFTSLSVLYKFKPHVIVGTGGYVSFPACVAAFILGIKIVIQEQNSFPGMENRLLAPFAEKIFLAFNGCVKHFQKEKCVVYGNPVRVSLRKYTSKAVARSHFFPGLVKKRNGEAQVVLVLGGSRGAPAINYTILNMYSDFLTENKNCHIIWQTGPLHFPEMESLVRRHRRLYLTPFVHEIDLAYAAADVIVSHAGAMICTEILATGIPSILIPWPSATDDHQTKNAYIMSDVAGSKVLTEDELDSSSLQTAIDEILGDEKLRQEISEKALNAARPNASIHIAKSILSLVNFQIPK